MATSGVVVAVRCRPFNAREVSMKATLIIDMNGPQTSIKDPETGKVSNFAFDFSYWSHDGFDVDPSGLAVSKPNNDKYADQRRVFNDIGVSVLNNAFQGFNCSLFAYGQTGAGKSYSMVGYGPNKGIIPITCDELFKRIEMNTDANMSYEVQVSMLEIYNEAIQDLFNPGKNPAGGLKIREKPGVGVYVDGLIKKPVTSYKEIDAKMEEGTKNRTVASTNMNATSSRAHTVFTIVFRQVSSDPNNPKVKSVKESNVNLVDLAGSERADSTGATGDRLKEGCAINQSLSALGNVISSLADMAGGKKGVFVPYRSSKLTRLLQDALGGNSKTVMIAALSPADVNYDETLSTLKYADRAKKIQNKAVINENPADTMIRKLKEENARLLKLLESKGIDGGVPGEAPAADGQSASHIAELQKTIEENDRLMQEMAKSWEQKLKEAREAALAAAQQAGPSDGSVSVHSAEASRLPHLVNLHEDPMLSECVVYPFKAGITKIGRPNAETKQDVMLSGLNIKKEHAVVENVDGKVTIRPVEGAQAKIFVNGDLVAAGQSTELSPGDAVILGNNFVFRFMPPGSVDDSAEWKDWSKAMEELSIKQGFRTQQNMDKEVSQLEQEEKKMLQEKIAEMEAKMEKERIEAARRLEEQRRLFIENGGDPEDIDTLMKEGEEAMKAKEKEMQESLMAQRELTKKIVQDQMKRKRQTKKIEQELGRLVPLVNEANSISEVLKKNIKFEAKLTIESPNVVDVLDELRHLKTIKVVVRVTNTVSQNVWTWSAEKFENRLFMMRDLYVSREERNNADDPFYDPPEPFEIGKAYVYLKALSHLVEIENEFTIVNYKGDTDGELRVEILPQGPNGEDLDYLQGGASELKGMTVGWTIRIVRASGLPLIFSHDVSVTFTFMGVEYTCGPMEEQTTQPEFAYEADIPPAVVTEETCRYFENEAIMFRVFGFREKQTALKQTTLVALGASIGEGTCRHCESEKAFFKCNDCALELCVSCEDLLHLAPSKASHKRAPLQVPAAPKADVKDPALPLQTQVPGAQASMCQQCEEQPSTGRCQQCNVSLCNGCWDFLHMAPSKASHTRVGERYVITSGTSAPGAGPGCQQCEERPGAVRCQECMLSSLCMDCFDFLHMAPSKASHARLPVGPADAPSPSPPAPSDAVKSCQFCEERPVQISCAECSQALCAECNDLLHLAPSKAGHTRTAV
ncbi:Kinesin motor domain-containing protein [Plasmodiophora brassicae]|uniref:Kinesin motor domain-containing protein n=2 Tax=Plasmodiophora brassicae TaxID=37360 RepID=A0A3P3YC72_PLABS|nr:unnamed protein product [Plasmodiophora brassicae]